MDYSNNTCSGNIDITRLRVESEEVLPAVMRSLAEGTDVANLVENTKVATSFLHIYEISKVEEELLKILMPAIMKALRNVCDENSSFLTSKSSTRLDILKCNLQTVLELLNVVNEVLDFILKYGAVELNNIRSVPSNLAQILVCTFEHCKNSQSLYNSHFESVTEILEVFRKSQELHSKFMCLFDALVIDMLCEEDLTLLKELLTKLVRISELFAGMNTKSMVETWKRFTALTHKYCDVLVLEGFDLSPPIKSLTGEIYETLESIAVSSEENVWIAAYIILCCIQLGRVFFRRAVFVILCNLTKNLKDRGNGPSDLKKVIQNTKVAGFLTKIVLKVFETFWSILDNFFECVLNFCAAVFSFPCHFFQSRRFPDEFLQVLNEYVSSNMEPFIALVLCEEVFLKKLASMKEDGSTLLVNYNFGYINFMNVLLGKLPEADRNTTIGQFVVVSIIESILHSAKHFSRNFLWYYGTSTYEKLVMNITVATFLFLNSYSKIEQILFEYVAQDEIWSALLAMDVWILVLRNSPPNTSKETLDAVISKLAKLNLGKFDETPAIVHLKILSQRIFQRLPNSAKAEVISKYDATNDIRLWNIVSMKGIPMSQRFVVECVLSDFYDKLSDVQNDSSYTFDELTYIIERFEVISSVNFNSLQLNASKLASFVVRFWSMNFSDMPPENAFYKYFVTKLCKITKPVIAEFNGENLLLMLHQAKEFVIAEPALHVPITQILKSISKRNINNLQEKFSLCSLISDIFLLLLCPDRSAIVTQSAVEILKEFGDNPGSYANVVVKVTASSPTAQQLFVAFMKRSPMPSSCPLDRSAYFGSLGGCKFQHRCLEWDPGQLPRTKKLRMGEAADDVIVCLQNEARRLVNAAKNIQLTHQQAVQLRGVIDTLQALC